MRGINAQGVLESLKMLRKIHNLSITTILERLLDSFHVKNFKVQLNMESSTINCNGKI